MTRHGTWAWLWYGISAGALSIVLGIAVIAIALPRLAGAVPLTVLSPSMSPSLPVGTMLVVRPLAQERLGDVRLGDVVSYQPNPLDPTLITHRVIGITSLQNGDFLFAVKGDANAHVDAPVRGLQVRARLWYSIPGLGWVNDLVNARGNRSWIIPAAAGTLFLYAGYTVVATGVAHAKRKQRASELASDLASDRSAATRHGPAGRGRGE